MPFSGADSRLALCQENFTGKRASSTFCGKPMPLLTGNHIKKGVIWKNDGGKQQTRPTREVGSCSIQSPFGKVDARHFASPSSFPEWATNMSMAAQLLSGPFAKQGGILGFGSFPTIVTYLRVKCLLHIWPVPRGAAAVSHSRVIGWSNAPTECAPRWLSGNHWGTGFHFYSLRNDPAAADTLALGHWAAKLSLNPWRSILERSSLQVCSTTEGPISVLWGRTGRSFRV